MKECDLIMKGGITSGVAYPYAISTVAREYRLRSIGGTSAGAIGAVVAAAAEFRRQESPDSSDFGGFEEIETIPADLGQNLQSLFQPTPAFQPVFDVMIAVIGAQKGRKLRALVGAGLWAFRRQVAAAGAAWLLVVLLAYFRDGHVGIWPVLFGLLLGVVLGAALIGWRLYRNAAHDLPAADYGLCPGIRDPSRPETDPPAFTDWMADVIDRVAGKDPKGDPLTVGELARHRIEVAAMTTDLSSRRPYQLPFRSNVHLFSESEFRRIFPARVVDYLVRKSGDYAARRSDPPDVLPNGEPALYLASGGDMPVLLVARLSLSFPGLISAVPLYRYDRTARGSDGQTPKGEIRRCVFSDGGISSNFPIHFFDAMLPSRPTFGIALTGFEPERHGGENGERTHLPDDRVTEDSLGVHPIGSLPGFLMAILNTAKDWQDTLQSLLPGYAERIVQIRLDDSKEGGLNLTMSPETVEQVSEYGRAAGQRLVDEFSFDEHRYRRAVITMPGLERALAGLAANYDRPPVPGGLSDLTYAQVLTDFPAKKYDGPRRAAWRRKVLKPFVDRLARVVRNDADAGKEPVPTPVGKGDAVPRVNADIRLVASANRVTGGTRAAGPAEAGEADGGGEADSGGVFDDGGEA